MALLTENEVNGILEQARTMEFKDSRKRVSFWILRLVCLFFGIVYLVLPLILLFSGNPAWLLFLMIGFCWIGAAIIFHLCWLRYAEIYVMKTLLPPPEPAPEEKPNDA